MIVFTKESQENAPKYSEFQNIVSVLWLMQIDSTDRSWSRAWCDLTRVTVTRDTVGNYPSRK